MPKDRSVERIIDVSQQVIVILAPKLELLIISHEASLMVIEIGFVQWNLQWDGRDQRTFGVPRNVTHITNTQSFSADCQGKR